LFKFTANKIENGKRMANMINKQKQYIRIIQ